MFNFVPKLAVREQRIQSIKRVTQDNIDIPALVLAADAAGGQVVRKYDPTLEVRFADMPKSIQSTLSAMNKGLRDIVNGVSFTLGIDFDPYNDGSTISSFAIHSSTRRDVIYTPTTNNCQCEGFEHHGVCKHHAIRQVFEVYVGLLQAEEALVRAYAKLGIELTPAEKFSSPTLNEGIEQILQEVFGESYVSSDDFSKLAGH